MEAEQTSRPRAQRAVPEPRRRTLRVTGIVRAGHVAHFRAVDEEGLEHTIFLRDMLDIVQGPGVREGGIVGPVWWIPVKRGQSYGIRMLML